MVAFRNGKWVCLLLMALAVAGCRSRQELVARREQSVVQLSGVRDSIEHLERQQRRVVELQWWGDTLPRPGDVGVAPLPMAGGYRVTYLDESLSQHREVTQATDSERRQASAENYLLQKEKSTGQLNLGLALGLTFSLLLIWVGRRIKKQLF